ncbi:2-hydroxyacid dehydrogenase [Peteryoungia desertarenae]|uniref:2-hydroxyacid dehydrogenase n=1 Tax=Peteryoungia desertarenae TaxID=1813451 RepID=A0ABX6QHW7_9HYPH|nr:2-hydroxyacid dehydrogenase [Peteryoungia desertarenae]QLF68159.1 2-hydroxyacid dehydrogenase [Peteryoungia desertarenae]
MTASEPYILIPGKIHPRVVERLAARFKLVQLEAGSTEVAVDLAPLITGAAVSGRFPEGLFDQLPNLRIIANFGVGYDGVPVRIAARRGIVVTNTPDVLNDEVADTTIALLLNTLRRLPAAENYLRAGRWVAEGAFPLSPLSLKGRHIGIHGLGRIGLEIAARLEPFKVKISYHTRRPRADVSYAYHDSLLSLARSVDTLISIVPKTAETIGSINGEILEALGPTGVLINVGRGTTVNEDDLIAALQAGRIAAAGLDVFADEPHVPAALLELPNVSLLPHVASASAPTRDAMADLVVDNLLSWFERGAVLTPVAETPVQG